MTGPFGTRETLEFLLDENKLPGPVHGSAEAGRGDRLAQCGFNDSILSAYPVPGPVPGGVGTALSERQTHAAWWERQMLNTVIQ